MMLTPTELELINSIRHSAKAYVNAKGMGGKRDFLEGMSEARHFIFLVEKTHSEAIKMARMKLI